MGGDRVIDRQQLNQFQMGFPGPVNQQPDISKLAYAKTRFGTKAENRNSHPAPFQVLFARRMNPSCTTVGFSCKGHWHGRGVVPGLG